MNDATSPSDLLVDLQIPALNASELQLVSALQNGLQLHMPGDERLPVRASMLRRLILEEPLRLDEESEPTLFPIPQTGLRLRRLRIVGEADATEADSGLLNLDDACGENGAALPPLELEDCLFTQPVWLSRARFRRLSFRGSKLCHLYAEGMRVEGPLNLSGISSSRNDTPHGLCWVQLHNIFAGDDVEANHSHFACPPHRSIPLASVEHQHALDLSGSDIRGRLSFGYCTSALGGITISRSTIGGQVWGCGATLTGVEGPAFMASGARIAGPVFLEYDTLSGNGWAPFRAIGTVNFHNAKLGSVLYMRGASIEKDAHGNAGLLASHLESGDSVLLCGAVRPAKYADPHTGPYFPFLCHGGVQMSDAVINGNLTMNGATLWPDWLGSAFYASGLTVTGQASLSVYKTRYDNSVLTESYPFTSTGRIVLTSAVFRMSLKLSGAQLLLTDPDQRYSLAANNAEVHGSCYFNVEQGLASGVATAFRLKAEGSIYLQNLKVGNDFDMSGAECSPSGRDWVALDLTGADIRSDALLRSSFPSPQGAPAQRFLCHGGVLLENTKIGNLLDFEGASIDGRSAGYAINAFHLTTISSVRMTCSAGPGEAPWPFKAQGRLDFTAAKIGTEMALLDAVVTVGLNEVAITTDLADIRSLVMERCTVTGSIQCEDFRASFGVKMTGTSMENGSLSFWESTLGFLDLTGLSMYQPPSDEPLLDLEHAKIVGKFKVQHATFATSRIPAKAVGPKLIADLRSLEIGELIDTCEKTGVSGWGDQVCLRLDGFLCRRAPHRDADPKAAADLRWLALQYEDPNNPKLSEYAPGAYDQLARALREEGYLKKANRVLSAKLTAQRDIEKGHARWISLAYEKFFDYGLSAKHALATFCLCILLGWVAVFFADRQDDLVLTTSTVNTVMFQRTGAKTASTGRPVIGLIHSKEELETDDIPCGDHIDTFLYALEVFVPALDLDQTRICEVSPKPSALPWRWGRALYAILGWIVTSITLLTIPGILRSRAEG